MKIREQLKYISNRVMLMGSILWAMFALLSVILMVHFWQKEEPVWPAVLLFLFSMGSGLVMWLWIRRPYLRAERMIKRFLDGYFFSESEDFDMAVLTPQMNSLMKMMEKIIRSPQMMDLNKRQAQYLALQNQINPHFLYNTLESIRGEALIAGLDSVADMTEALAKFFRYTITKVENLVSVEEELDNCETYFGIQKYRFGDRLNLHVEYDESEYEKIMNCRIPKLTLQPILENSIIHGTELKLEAGNICIHFECTQDRLVIRISDDGVGMDEETLEKLNRKLGRAHDSLGTEDEKKGGIALANVNNRIHLIFGDEYGMHVYSVPENGTDVEISIPLTFMDGDRKELGVPI